ncbi:MAG: hypothetical protein JW755_10575 [Candidatus Aminicenantes bacterium]|nr:hypothetical protein [Candidatus Aminicenantes bacterium]
MKEKKTRLDKFLKQKEIQLHQRERFIRRTSRSNPLVNVDYSIFLDENQRLKKFLFPLVRDIILQHNLKIYFVMVSWWGRGDEALWTGSHLLNTLGEFKKKGICEIFLSYQEGEFKPSSLCQWCQKRKIETFFVDRFQLVSSQNKKVVIPFRMPGKAENVIKCLKLIERKTKDLNLSSDKILIIFMDDDYTQYHWLNYFLLFAPWVLSFAGKTNDSDIDRTITKIKKISFIKSGSPRIILPYELQKKIVKGQIEPLDYLGLTQALLELALSNRRYRKEKLNDDYAEIASLLIKAKHKGQIYTPKNKGLFLSDRLNEQLENLWGEYIYRGGRVTSRLEGILRHLIHKNTCRWMRQFTFLLHGDQGATLESWLEFSPFSGYALEVSLLMEAVCDKAFEHHQILNITGLPHSHQRSKDLNIWQMFDNILLSFDLLRVLYKSMSHRNFLSMYGIQRHVPMLDRFGNIIYHLPQYTGLKIYPPLKALTLE